MAIRCCRQVGRWSIRLYSRQVTLPSAFRPSLGDAPTLPSYAHAILDSLANAKQEDVQPRDPQWVAGRIAFLHCLLSRAVLEHHLLDPAKDKTLLSRGVDNTREALRVAKLADFAEPQVCDVFYMLSRRSS